MASGNIFVTGYGGTGDYDPGPGTVMHTAAGPGGNDTFTSKFGSDGSLAWARFLTASSSTVYAGSNAHAIAVDSAGSASILAIGTSMRRARAPRRSTSAAARWARLLIRYMTAAVRKVGKMGSDPSDAGFYLPAIGIS
jgi:hypothetical protein